MSPGNAIAGPRVADDTPAQTLVAAEDARVARRRRRRPRPPSVPTRMRRAVLSAVSLGLLAACLLGIVLRLWVQDRRATSLAMYYYATPPAVLAAAALGAALLWLVRKRWRPALPTLLLSLVCAAWSYQVTWFQNPPGPTTPGGHVLFWNVAHGTCGWRNIAGDIRKRNADIIGLVEAGTDLPRLTAFWERQLPGYQAHVCQSGITLLARGEVQHVASGSLNGYGSYEHFETPVGGRPLHVVVVDFEGTLARTRLWPVEALVGVLEPLAGQPVLLMGDFNTPTDSFYLTPLRRRLTNAFEVAGDGCAATWPCPLPVLTIDQAWFNERVRVARCTHGWTWYSDHRPVELEVSVAP